MKTNPNNLIPSSKKRKKKKRQKNINKQQQKKAHNIENNILCDIVAFSVVYVYP